MKPTSNQIKNFSTVSGNTLTDALNTLKLGVPGTGNGDMNKSVYDPNNNGIVDAAETVPWIGVTDKPTTFPPQSHTHLKSEVGLSNVDNTSDINKPVSTAQATAIAVHPNTVINAHAASAISNTPSGNVSSTTVQAAINELDTEKYDKIGGDINGNINFTGTSRRITGDFSNATMANRLMFQTNTLNMGTSLGIIPNGTGSNSAYNAFSSTDLTNSSFVQFRVGTDTNDARITSGAFGTGSFLPLTFYTNGLERMRISIAGVTQIMPSAGEGGQIDIMNPDGTTAGFSIDVSTSDTCRLFSARNNSIFNIGQLVGTGGVVGLFSGGLERFRINADGSSTAVNSAGLGYGAGSGGTVTQATSKSTAVTLNKPCGTITTSNSLLSANTSVYFTFNNSFISSSDILTLSLFGGGAEQDRYHVSAGVFNGGAYVSIRNMTTTNYSELLQINFAVLKVSQV